MAITIVLENLNGTLEYFDLDLNNQFNEARAFYFQNELDVFEIRKDFNNGYYDLVNPNIFYKKKF